MKKLTHKLLLVLVLCLSFITFYPQQVNATSNNTKAHKAYEKQFKKIVSSYPCTMHYYYKDLNADKIDEAIVYYDSQNSSSDIFKIFTYKNGKVKTLINDTNLIYGIEKVTYYKKSKSLVIYSFGHGYEYYHYFKYTKGNYKLVAYKYREYMGYIGPWNYKANDKSISSQSFNKLIKGIKKGKATTISYQKFKIMVK